MKLNNKIKVAIDSPAAAGAGTQAKLISQYFNLYYSISRSKEQLFNLKYNKVMPIRRYQSTVIDFSK